MSLVARITAAAQAASADGRSVHHVSLAGTDWPPSLPSVSVKPAFKADQSVLWAMDAKGLKLVPYPLGEAA